ncbi:hypothetical protein VE02_02395 [Pseudogymnoascus sp. 03VT05]|nr:hypothetical protein VE02_02395 [Pseudogymnoascus sp. 03VT05]
MSTSPGNHGQLITSAYTAVPTSKSADPVQEAFDDASNLEDVSNVLLKARVKYETSKKSRARVWLSKFSARVVHYGKIIDVMAQHHPEYVSLVWGAMKFLFIAVLNQEELIAELSKALSAISDALLRVNLSVILYPTEPMRQTVSMLYARIIRFFHRAMMWYKESRFKHMLTAITRPAALRYKDLVADISDYVGRVDKLASSSANAELRDVHNG